MDFSRKGRQLVIVVIAVILGASILLTIITNPLLETQGLGRDVIRFILTLLFCYFLYQGKNWARWVVGLLLGLGGVVGVFGGISLMMTTPSARFLLLLGLAYLGCVYILFFVPSVRAFFQQ